MKENKKIIHILMVMCSLFLILVGYLTYFELFTGDHLATNAFNRRQWAKEDDTLRGSIYDRNGVLLANSKKVKGKNERVYPYNNLYSQVIGYNSRIYGKSLLEAKFNNYLLNINGLNSIFAWKENFKSKEDVGNNVYLTIDHKIQKLADNLLGDKNGAAVVMNPKTGEILAMVSKPDFNPNSKELSDNWKSLVDSKDYPFLTRATQGLYAPGSTFKVVIGAAAIENSLVDAVYEDKGVITIDGKPIYNSGKKALGTINVENAFTLSSNVVFSQLGVKLGESKLKEIANRFGMEKEIPFDIPTSRSTFPYVNMEKTDMAAVGIGQGKILVSPLHMAMIASSIANKGVMEKPVLVNRVISPKGSVVKKWGPDDLYRVMSPEVADRLKKMMIEVVKNGTGKSAAISGIKVAGKTGTAENELTVKGEGGKEHAWFIGFAPADNPKVAVAVVVEYSGSTGGKVAAPIARQLMEACVKKK